jgi:hypothetical protein
MMKPEADGYVIVATNAAMLHQQMVPLLHLQMMPLLQQMVLLLQQWQPMMSSLQQKMELLQQLRQILGKKMMDFVLRLCEICASLVGTCLIKLTACNDACAHACFFVRVCTMFSSEQHA